VTVLSDGDSQIGDEAAGSVPHRKLFETEMACVEGCAVPFRLCSASRTLTS